MMTMVRRLFLALVFLSPTACTTDTVVLSPTSFYAAYTPTVWIERREQVHRDLTDQLAEAWVAGIAGLANFSGDGRQRTFVGAEGGMDPHFIATLGGDAMIEPAEFQIRMVLRSVEYQYDAIGRGKRLRRCGDKGDPWSEM